MSAGPRQSKLFGASTPDHCRLMFPNIACQVNTHALALNNILNTVLHIAEFESTVRECQQKLPAHARWLRMAMTRE
ncbi:hypothetical protein HYQ46_006089 [Verticillium longisporum]|nr:hypothetical protein HYQ46_006089 [Verticillium longisporum]